MKTIQGPEENKLMDELKIYFKKVQRVKPTASRSESREMYLMCHNYYMSDHPELKKRIDQEKRKRELSKTPEGKSVVQQEEFDQQKELARKYI